MKKGGKLCIWSCKSDFSMVSMIVHSVSLSISQMLVAHLTHNSGCFNMFGFNMVDHISLNTRQIITFCALKLVQVTPDKHGPNNPIKFFKRNSSCNTFTLVFGLGLKAMVSVIMHSVGLSSSQMFMTQLTDNTWRLEMF